MTDYAKAGIIKAADAACGSPCAAAANYLLGSGCTPKGGTLWCVEECTKTCAKGLCSDRQGIKPIRLSDRSDYQKRTALEQTAMGTMVVKNCCTKTYCQMPGQPPPSDTTGPGFWTMLTSSASTPTALPTAGVKLTAVQVTVPAAYPAGSIAALDPKTWLWHIAVPITSGLGAPATPYDVPWATTPSVWHAFDRESWYGVHIADRPYRATVGLSGDVTHREIEASAQSPGNATVVVYDDYGDKTGTRPFYQRPWFIAAVAGVVLAAAGGAVYYIRSRR